MKGQVQALFEDIRAFRRELHENPELSGEEVETSKKIQAKLDEYGITYFTGYAKTGILAVIEGGKPGKTVGLRADIDALPILEKADVPFKSKVDGKMHACGHDAHTAMLLGVGKLLQDQKSEIAGTVLLIFQPAEENAPTGGSEQMMEDGVFDKYKPDVLLAQHVWPGLPAGQVGIIDGAIMGNSDRFEVTIHGSGGHASMPHQTVDAIIIANQVISAIQTIISRNANPMDSGVITIGKISGGYRYNVVADTVVLEGTIRSLSDDTKKLLKKRFREVVKGAVEMMGGTCEIDYSDGYPATVNTKRWAEVIRESAKSTLGDEGVPEVIGSMAGEDFGRFLKKYEGVYYWLGTSVGENQKPLHDPGFMIDEDALAIGTEVMAQAALDVLSELNG
ncbi:M20 family metallopeptidase [Planococcus sp. ISL-109]|uniref:M20 metallopeptidase family protein n=1 Tax=Planococcus sp. ISL-109 TaxID=2819166 RepID=UPI001BE7790E|nr:M20 family metallopeptidase [Planococcus sp. ISL-109]MBT2582152.1 amidohydrolase [Planococcus sp. ISL-109]